MRPSTASISSLTNVFQGFTQVSSRRQLLVTDVEPRRKCVNCELRNECSGGCPAYNFIYSGNIFDSSPLTCQFAYLISKVHTYSRRRLQEAGLN